MTSVRKLIKQNYQAATGRNLNIDSATYRAAAEVGIEDQGELTPVINSGALVFQSPARPSIIPRNPRYEDAESIIGPELASELEARTTRLTSRTESEADRLLNSGSNALVIKRRTQQPSATDMRADRFHQALVALRSCGCGHDTTSRKYTGLRGNLDQVARQILLSDGELPVDEVMLEAGLSREALIRGMIRRGVISKSELGLPEVERAVLDPEVPSGMQGLRKRLPIQLDSFGNQFEIRVPSVRKIVRARMGLR